MRMIINIPDEWMAGSIKKYGIRRVTKALQNSIEEGLGEWDIEACIETDIANQEEADKILRKKK